MLSFHKRVRRYVFLAAGIPIIIGAAIVFYTGIHEFNFAMDNFADNTLESLREYIDDFETTNVRITRLFAEHPVIDNADIVEDKKKIMATILGYESIVPEINSIALGMENGAMYTRQEAQLPKGYDPRIRPWYVDAKNVGEGKIIRVTYRDAIHKGEYIVSYSTPVRSKETGKFIGVVGTDISLSRLALAIGSYKLPHNAELLIVDKTGKLVLAGKQVAGSFVKNGAIIKKLQEITVDKQQLMLGTRQYFVFKRSTNDALWNIYYIVPQSEYILIEVRILAVTVVMLCVLLLGAVIVAGKIQRYIIRPLDVFTEKLNSVELGEEISPLAFSKQLPVEMLGMQETINRMIGRISEQGVFLKQQKDEINSQYMEINALYEETAAMNETLESLLVEQKQAYSLTIKSLSNAIEANDTYTKGHCERVTQYSVDLAKKAGFGGSDLDIMEIAATLHDIGKVGIPTEILRKPERLSVEEYEIIKQHPSIGYRIIADIPYLSRAAIVLYQHHEGVDGGGYPAGLIGEQIEPMARILCIADAFDAMTTVRPYRDNPMTKAEALQELLGHAGRQFDRELVELFVQWHEEQESDF